MLDQHTTRDGLTILIAEMDDRHLLNTIKLFTKDLPALEQHSTVEKGERDVLYNRPGHVEPEDAVRMWRGQVNRIYSYAAEALLRDTIREEAAKILQAALGRSTAIEQTPRLGHTLLLDAKFEEDDIPF